MPSDCLLLWQPKDAGLLAYFIDKMNDPAEKERAWQRYHTVRRFAESARCRHLQICTHFGQTPKWQRCEMCDVCGNVPEWLKAPLEETAAPRKRRETEEGATGVRGGQTSRRRERSLTRNRCQSSRPTRRSSISSSNGAAAWRSARKCRHMSC